MRRILLAAILGIGLPGALARACLNDRETKGREIEFKAQYPTRSITDEPTPESSALTYVLFGAGALLGMADFGMGGAIGVKMMRKSS